MELYWIEQELLWAIQDSKSLSNYNNLTKQDSTIFIPHSQPQLLLPTNGVLFLFYYFCIFGRFILCLFSMFVVIVTLHVFG
jgi:Golgi nucleoside diphosphatase